MRHLFTAAAAAVLLVACGSQGGGNEAAGDKAAEGGGGGGSEGGGGTAVADAGAAMQPGLWETTVEVTSANVSGMPGGVTPPTGQAFTARNCLTPEQAARPNADFFGGGGQAGGCTYENFSMEGGRIQGTMTCNMQGATTRVTMDGRFGATSYQMTQRSQVNLGGMTTDSETRVTGRRVGDCPA